MTDYALRCTQQDKPQLIHLGMALGVLQIVQERDPETNQLVNLQVTGAQGSAWDEIGPIYENDLPILAPDGEPYWHANLRTEVNLAEAAAAAGIPDDGLSRWFVVGPDGRPVLPTTPARVWL